VRKEIAASEYPTYNSRGPDYSALLPDNSCDCPKCRRARGEMPSPFDDDDFDDKEFDENFDDEQMQRIFNERVPEGMPPELAQMLFEVLKEGYRNGLSPDEILEGLDDMGGFGAGSSGKGKKGNRK